MRVQPLKYVCLDNGLPTLLHIYKRAPGSTLCGRPVHTGELGWYSTGCPMDDPTFPFGPICEECRGLAPPVQSDRVGRSGERPKGAATMKMDTLQDLEKWLGGHDVQVAIKQTDLGWQADLFHSRSGRLEGSAGGRKSMLLALLGAIGSFDAGRGVR